MIQFAAFLVVFFLSSAVWGGERGEIGLRLKQEGLYWRIIAISPGGEAAKVGLRVGDFVTRINNVTFPSEEQLLDTVAALEPGDLVRMSIVDGPKGEKSFELVARSSPN